MEIIGNRRKRDLVHFFLDGTKFKIPSDIALPLTKKVYCLENGTTIRESTTFTPGRDVIW